MSKGKAEDPRAAALAAVLGAVRAKFKSKEAAITFAAGAVAQVAEVVPTGIGVLDHYIIGCHAGERAGFPVGRLSEVFSEEGAGKSSLALQACGQAQKLGGLALFSDAEHSLSEERARVFGVDLGQLCIMQPLSLEDLIDQGITALNAIPKGVGPNLWVWDSLAAAPTRAELMGEAGDVSIGARARLLSVNLPKFLRLAQEKRTHILVVNQVRDKMGVVFGNKSTTPGGKALKFYASVRLQLLGGKAVKSGMGHIAKDLTIMCVKNRFKPPYRKARVRFNYATGWDDEWSTVRFAKELGVVGGRSMGPAALEAARAHFAAHSWEPTVGASTVDLDGEEGDDADTD